MVLDEVQCLQNDRSGIVNKTQYRTKYIPKEDTDTQEINNIIKEAYRHLNISKKDYWKMSNNKFTANKEKVNFYRQLSESSHSYKLNKKITRKGRNCTQFILPNIWDEIKGRYRKVLDKRIMNSYLPIVRPTLCTTSDMLKKKILPKKMNIELRLNKESHSDRLFELCKNIRDLLTQQKAPDKPQN